MKNKKNYRPALTALGCVFILAALILLIISSILMGKIHVNIDNTVDFIENILPDKTASVKESRSNNEMPSVTYDGQDYSAVLFIPRLSVKLPIRSSWDKTAVNKVPCRFTGSVYDGSLVIGGVDSEGLFDFVSKIDIGDMIKITDMNGAVFSYTVSNVKHAKNAKADTIIDENYDLTLFAKDKKSGDWLLVRCKMN